MKEQRRSFEGSSTCSAPASTVWSVWTNPPEWPGGVIDAAKIDGNFVVGAKITMKVKGGPPTTSTVTRVDPPRMWVGVSKFPGLTMTYEHMIEASDGSTVLSERVVMSGPFAGVAGRLMGNRLEETFAASTGRIARLAEARPHNEG
jgi:Polyketide cyclase / dehydrase and lipid transport